MADMKERVFNHGRPLILDFCILVRMTAMYDAMNSTVLNAGKKLVEDFELFLSDRAEISIKNIDGSFYIEDERVRATTADVENFTFLSDELGKRSIGELTFKAPVQTDDIIYLAYAIRGGDEATEIQTALESKLKKAFSIGGPVSLSSGSGVDVRDSQTMARLAYLRSVAAYRETDASVKTGQPLNFKKVKKALQSIVDCILQDESYMLGFTTVRDMQDYYHYHAVNVAVLSVAIGKRVELSRYNLGRLATAAFLHDTGKMDIPSSILAKKGEYSPKEMELIEMHPVGGVKIILRTMGLNEYSILAMLVSYEHHMKLDVSGYPRAGAERKLNPFSRIVSIADDYDSYVSGRVYDKSPLSTENALKLMWGGSGTHYDTALLKAFIGLFR